MDVTTARAAVDRWLRALAEPPGPAPSPRGPQRAAGASASPSNASPAPNAVPRGEPAAPTGAFPAPDAAPEEGPTAQAVDAVLPGGHRNAGDPGDGTPVVRGFPRSAGTPRGHAVPGLDTAPGARRLAGAFTTRPSAAAPRGAVGRPYLRPADEQGLPPTPRAASAVARGPVDVAAALAPLLAAPGTVHVGRPPAEPDPPTHPAAATRPR